MADGRTFAIRWAYLKVIGARPDLCRL
jgi:hypothetical protein